MPLETCRLREQQLHFVEEKRLLLGLGNCGGLMPSDEMKRRHTVLPAQLLVGRDRHRHSDCRIDQQLRLEKQEGAQPRQETARCQKRTCCLWIGH